MRCRSQSAADTVMRSLGKYVAVHVRLRDAGAPRSARAHGSGAPLNERSLSPPVVQARADLLLILQTRQLTSSRTPNGTRRPACNDRLSGTDPCHTNCCAACTICSSASLRCAAQARLAARAST
eukprot:2864359-Pleurochrysis_carterae.AAC.5